MLTSACILESQMAKAIAEEILAQGGGQPFPHVASLARPRAAAERGFPRTVFTRRIGGRAFFLLDITIDEDGQFRLVEANASNGAYSSALMGHDELRADHMAEAILDNRSRLRVDKPVALFAHQQGFHFPSEFYPRVLLTARRIAEQFPTAIHRPGEPLCETLPVVVGTTTAIAGFMALNRAGHLYYRDRRVAFVQNCNLSAELIRQAIVPAIPSDDTTPDWSVFHEGLCFPIAHDKGLQQDICEGTGIEPINWIEARNSEEFCDSVAEFHRGGKPAVAKINSGSGGTGIELFSPEQCAEEVQERLQRMIVAAAEKYGDGVDRTIWPIRLFEFVRSRPLRLGEQGFAWDMRVCCMLRSGQVAIFPTVIRRTPGPFSMHDRSGWVSNLSGRRRSMDTIYSALDDAVLGAIGIDDEMFEDLITACSRWCEAAWQFSSKTHPRAACRELPQSEFEDDASRCDPNFYLNRQL